MGSLDDGRFHYCVPPGRSYYTPYDVYKVPYGTFAAVQGTPYDFLKPRQIGSEQQAVKADFWLPPGGGYDAGYVLW